MTDVMHTLRMLARQPRHAGFIVVTLAVAVAATTVIFSFVNALVLEPLPMAEPDRVVLIFGTNGRQGVTRGGSSLPDFLDWLAVATSFEELAASTAVTTWSLDSASGPVPARGRRVTSNFAQTWGLTPALGSFSSFGDEGSGERVVLLSYGFWTRQFGSDPGIIGRSIRLDGGPYTVAAIMRPNLEIGDLALTDLWIPLRLDESDWPRGRRSLQVTALRRSDVSVERADAELSTISRSLADLYPETNGGWGVRVLGFAEAMAIPDTWVVLGLASFAVVLVLFVACANVASLMLARAFDGRRTVAVCMALGARPRQIVGPMALEAVMLGLLGAGSGLLLAFAGLEVVRALTFHPFFQQQVDLDHRVLGFVLLMAFVTPLLFGLGPAMTAVRVPLLDALKSGGQGLVSGRGTQRARAVLVVSQIAVALALLVVCVLAVRAAVTLRTADLGFDTARMLTMRADLPDSRYATPRELAAFTDEVLAGVARIPGVRRVAAATHLPALGAQPTTPMTIQGRANAEERPGVVPAAISPEYFRTLGLEMLAGRGLSPRDTADAPGVAVLGNETVRRYWRGRDQALGARIQVDGMPSGAWLEVVGIVGDVRRSLAETTPGPHVYVALAQQPARRPVFVIRTGDASAEAAAEARDVVRRVDPSLAVYDLRTFDEALNASLANDRLTAGLFAAFALVAVFLASIGLFGLIEYAVVRRTGELALRMILGARRIDILSMVVVQGLRLTVTGIAAGLLVAYPLAQLFGGAVRGVDASAPWTYAGIAALLVAIALMASYVPARRAVRVNLAGAVRSE